VAPGRVMPRIQAVEPIPGRHERPGYLSADSVLDYTQLKTVIINATD
jgi:hypothetical protein